VINTSKKPRNSAENGLKSTDFGRLLAPHPSRKENANPVVVGRHHATSDAQWHKKGW
jgi:hypothetical protein